MFLDGLSGSFFRPLAIAYILAILASLLVALTVTPALSLMLLPGGRAQAPRRPPEPGAQTGLWPNLASVSQPSQAVAGFLAVMFAVTIGAFLSLGKEFLPNFRETDFLMHWVEKPGTSLDAMRRITIRASKELRGVDGVRNFGSHIGRAEVADEVVGPNFTELWISIREDVPHDETVAKNPGDCRRLPRLEARSADVSQRGHQRSALRRAGAIVVRVFGPDLAALRSKAQDVKKVMEDVGGVTNLQVESQALVPQLQVRLRPDAAARFGLTGGQVRRAVDTLVKGTKVGEVYYDQMSFDTLVWGVPSVRSDMAAICKLPIDLPQGGYVPLGDVADIEIVPAPNEIKREGASRRIDITCNVKGRDLGSVARDIEAKVREMNFDRGYHPEFLGEYAALEASQRRLVALSIMSLVGILLLLQLDFRSWKLAFLVLFTIPFALLGAVAGTFCKEGAVAGFAGRVCDRAGNRRTKRHHACQSLPSSRGSRRRGIRPRARATRIRRTAGADSDDGPGDRPGTRPVDLWR